MHLFAANNICFIHSLYALSTLNLWCGGGGDEGLNVRGAQLIPIVVSVQELVTPDIEQEAAPTESTTRERMTFDIAVDIIDDRVTVDLEQVTMIATASREGETRTLELDEETDTAVFTLPALDEQAAASDVSAWDVLTDILAVPAVAPDHLGTGPALPDPVPIRPRSTASVMDHIRVESGGSSPAVMRRRLGAAREYEVIKFAEWDGLIDLEDDSEHNLGGVYRPPAAIGPSVQIRGTSDLRPAAADDAEREPAVTVTDDMVRYTVDVQLAADDATVMDTILSLVDADELDATLVEQPYYSPESFDISGEDREAGWQSGYWFVQLEDFDVHMTEFSYGADTPELAMDGIDEITVSAGDQVVFEEAEMYGCGGYDVSEEMRQAWEEKYRWFDDDTERAVYAALAEGNEFVGTSLDMHDAGLDAVRDAYIEDFGVAPENVFDSVVYDH